MPGFLTHQICELFALKLRPLMSPMFFGIGTQTAWEHDRLDANQGDIDTIQLKSKYLELVPRELINSYLNSPQFYM